MRSVFRREPQRPLVAASEFGLARGKRAPSGLVEWMSEFHFFPGKKNWRLSEQAVMAIDSPYNLGRVKPFDNRNRFCLMIFPKCITQFAIHQGLRIPLIEAYQSLLGIFRFKPV